MNKDKLNKLADFLDNLEDSKFYFGSVVEDWVGFEKDYVCGSVCCAIGWTPKLFPDEVKWAPGAVDNLSYEGNSDLDYSDVAARLFNIAVSDADTLFSPNRTPHDPEGWIEWGIRVLDEAATPKEVAENIRYFIEMKEHLNKETNKNE